MIRFSIRKFVLVLLKKSFFFIIFCVQLQLLLLVYCILIYLTLFPIVLTIFILYTCVSYSMLGWLEHLYNCFVRWSEASVEKVLQKSSYRIAYYGHGKYMSERVISSWRGESALKYCILCIVYHLSFPS